MDEEHALLAQASVDVRSCSSLEEMGYISSNSGYDEQVIISLMIDLTVFKGLFFF
jgi:hypothetical protein